MPSKRKKGSRFKFLGKKEFRLALLGVIFLSAVSAALVISGGEPTKTDGSDSGVLTKPPSTGPVRISDGQLIVNGEPFFIKGVAYAPTPIGYSYAYNIFGDPDIYTRDLPLLRAMHCNTIRTWSKVTEGFLDAAYNNGVDPIYVIAGFYVEPYNVSSETYRLAVINEFREYVRAYKDHPALLMWAVGNEVNYEVSSIWPGDDNKLRDWYTLLNELAKVAYEEEGDTYHPVITANWETTHIGETSLGSDDNSMNFLDAWGVNTFRVDAFGDVFQYYPSSKPLLITEFGIDAWDTIGNKEDEATQSEYDALLWDQIVEASNTSAVLGGCVMGYSDVWWRAGDPTSHDTDGDEMLSFPDGFNNQEWWGIMRVRDNGAGPDIVEPRAVYYTLQEKWA